MRRSGALAARARWPVGQAFLPAQRGQECPPHHLVDCRYKDLTLSSIESALYDLGETDTLAAQNTLVHRLDPRAKVLTTALFLIAVASFPRYEVTALLPFFLYPVVLAAIGNVPARFLARKLLIAAPFVLFVGVFNPLFDREVLVRVGSFGVSGGWVSFASILLRFVLTVTAALLLVATTGLYPMCLALERLRVPRAFVVQLLFLYRYLFVLVAETARVVRAHSLRSSGRRMRLRVLSSVVGQLLLRTLDRAQRIHTAMQCRGFDGQIRLARPLHCGIAELLFVAGWAAFFALARWQNLPALAGTLLKLK